MRNIDWIKRGMVLLTGFLLWGCASTRDVRFLDEEVLRLQSQMNQLQKENGILNKNMESLRTNLTADNKRVEADLSLRVDTLQSEMRSLSTNVEEYKDYLTRPSKEIGRVKENVEARLKFLEEKGKAVEERSKATDEKMKGLEDRFKAQEAKAAVPPPKTAETENPLPGREGPPEVRGVSAGTGDIYKDAYETFQKGNLEEARRKFEAFLKQYPNTELSDNAQFWIGETYYLKKQFDKAILEYEKAIVKYPEGDKIPAAMLKQALSFLELGDKTNARNLLKRVIERYPRSDQAELAKKKLETIK